MKAYKCPFLNKHECPEYRGYKVVYEECPVSEAHINCHIWGVKPIIIKNEYANKVESYLYNEELWKSYFVHECMLNDDEELYYDNLDYEEE